MVIVTFYYYLSLSWSAVTLLGLIFFPSERYTSIAYKLLVAFGEVQLFSGDGEEEEAYYSKLCRFKKQLQTIKDNYEKQRSIPALVFIH